MPSRNVIKQFAEGHYYHIFNRGVAKQPIFKDDLDKNQFIKILRRHLDPDDDSNRQDGVPYPKYNKDIELLCYCLMGNHFHLLIFVIGDPNNVSKLMQSVLTAYAMFFNKRHKRVGTLFQGVFKASRISKDDYLMHITRYIHMNPKNYKAYKFSSLSIYTGKSKSSWVKPKRVLQDFDNDDYITFLHDYEDEKHELEQIKHELADV